MFRSLYILVYNSCLAVPVCQSVCAGGVCVCVCVFVSVCARRCVCVCMCVYWADVCVCVLG